MARTTAMQALVTRDNIVLAAAAAFAEHGYAKPSLDEIAARAHVTRGAIYVHFKNREEIFCAVCDLVSWPLLDQPPRASCQSECDPLGTLKSTIRLWLGEIERSPIRQQVLDIVLHKTEWTADNAALLSRVHRSNEAAIVIIKGLLEQAAARGDLLIPIDMATASTALHAALLGVVSASLRHSLSAELSDAACWVIESVLGACTNKQSWSPSNFSNGNAGR